MAGVAFGKETADGKLKQSMKVRYLQSLSSMFSFAGSRQPSFWGRGRRGQERWPGIQTAECTLPSF